MGKILNAIKALVDELKDDHGWEAMWGSITKELEAQSAKEDEFIAAFKEQHECYKCGKPPTYKPGGVLHLDRHGRWTCDKCIESRLVPDPYKTDKGDESSSSLPLHEACSTDWQNDKTYCQYRDAKNKLDGPYICALCGDTFAQFNGTYYLDNDMFVCTECAKTPSERAKSPPPNIESKYTCDHCGKVCKENEFNLYKYMCPKCAITQMTKQEKISAFAEHHACYTCGKPPAYSPYGTLMLDWRGKWQCDICEFKHTTGATFP